jgi:hypothetical protein
MGGVNYKDFAPTAPGLGFLTDSFPHPLHNVAALTGAGIGPEAPTALLFFAGRKAFGSFQRGR